VKKKKKKKYGTCRLYKIVEFDLTWKTTLNNPQNTTFYSTIQIASMDYIDDNETISIKHFHLFIYTYIYKEEKETQSSILLDI
jgi:hypothetical protein